MQNDSGRTGFVFRYSDPTTWAFIGYDINNNWVWVNGAAQYGVITTSGPSIPAGGSIHLKVQYTGSNIIVWVDGTEIFNGSLSNLPTNSGKIGVRNWSTSIGSYDNLQYYQ